MESFNNTKLNENILIAINEMGFEKPTLIQAQTIPHLMFSKQDLIATAQTGTGKTGAFGLPAVHLTHIEEKQTQTLVLCPTRELCIQIAKDLTNFSKYINGLNIVAVYGGASIDTQTKALRKGAHIVIGTPGRTKDLIRRKRLHLADIRRIILDEADEMLTMGFKDDLEAILAETPEKKQTILFSATMFKKIVSITKTYMQNPVEISASRVNLGAENVKHIYFMVHASDRYEVLKRIADMNPNIYGITFCRTRKETKEIANKLMHDGYNADAIHGDLSQAQRDEVMGQFRKRKLHMLVATDVAARGLDVNDLTHVINFNLPDDAEIYVHRSGRTGRAGKSGISIAIIHTRETRKIREIERISKISFSKERVPSGKDICQKQLYALIDKIKKVDVDENQIEPFLPTIYEKLESLDREELIKHFVSAEFNQFLTYYKNAKDINLSKSKKPKQKDQREKLSRKERQCSTFESFFINVGSNHNVNPARLMGIINEGLNSRDAMIGRIDVMKKFSFFEIDASKKNQIIKSLNGKIIGGTKLSVEVAKEKPESDLSFSKGRSSRSKGRSKKEDRKRSKKKQSGSRRRKK
ncbi:MAG: DEAD/DEAH box helicase [Candidatus Marinimicrobia bacterium]|jgi:ATP-dependent RNA helicase DeaD|nr:DEAD/DEAH box helicase [Candidatus Neomarinimicrobiota bacterium]MDP6935872.1 DEAD/DEAH box helicase [Candidatus Neomarinimicrobiota bacterium]